jgi:hypothetical protein
LGIDVEAIRSWLKSRDLASPAGEADAQHADASTNLQDPLAVEVHSSENSGSRCNFGGILVYSASDPIPIKAGPGGSEGQELRRPEWFV